jgi:hypothetical protein
MLGNTLGDADHYAPGDHEVAKVLPTKRLFPAEKHRMATSTGIA